MAMGWRRQSAQRTGEGSPLEAPAPRPIARAAHQARPNRRRAEGESATPPPVAAVVEAHEVAPPAPRSSRRDPLAELRTSTAEAKRGTAWALALGALLCACVVAAARGGRLEAKPEGAVAARVDSVPPGVESPARAPSAPAAPASAAPAGPYASIPGGVVYVPRALASSGSADLLLHFHGDVRAVVEGAEAARVQALVAVVNLGEQAKSYADAYAKPGALAALVGHIERASGVRPGRVALSAWSSGTGAVRAIAADRQAEQRLDAVLVSEGIHTTWRKAGSHEPDPAPLAPFARLAERAAHGELLFSVAHASVESPSQVGVEESVDVLLRYVSAERKTTSASLPWLELPSAQGAPRGANPLVLSSEARKGSLHVRGFEGRTAGDHAAQLTQLGATLFPELATRWARR
jgi:hypothetical protein